MKFDKTETDLIKIHGYWARREKAIAVRNNERKWWFEK